MKTILRVCLGVALSTIVGCLATGPKPWTKTITTRVDAITFVNRHYPGLMFGGWGPHLRGLMRASNGSLWFTSDQGPDVEHNEQIIYYRRDDQGWHEVAKQNHLPGVQQNVASVMAADQIFSYGVSIRDPRFLEECSFNTLDAKKRTCAPIQIGGKPLLLWAGCNYVGATVSPSGRKLVWWTTVGVNGAEGKWSYIYESRHEWIGPIVSALNGYNDFAYIYAAFSSETTVSLAGQLYAGAYPHGSFALGAVEFRLGETIRCTAFTTNTPVWGRSASDIVLHNGGTHLIAETPNGSVAYYFKPSGQSWTNHQIPIGVLTSVHRARFLDSGGDIYLITGGLKNESLLIRRMAKSKMSGAVDWANLPAFQIPTTEPALAAPSAIFVESSSYQTTGVHGLNFAVAGHYPDFDHEIWQVEAKLR